MKVIIGVKLCERKEDSEYFQSIISEFGCGIKTRIGLHDTFDNKCSNEGIVLLEVVDQFADELFSKLSRNWYCQKMVF